MIRISSSPPVYCLLTGIYPLKSKHIFLLFQRIVSLIMLDDHPFYQTNEVTT